MKVVMIVVMTMMMTVAMAVVLTRNLVASRKQTHLCRADTTVDSNVSSNDDGSKVTRRNITTVDGSNADSSNDDGDNADDNGVDIRSADDIHDDRCLTSSPITITSNAKIL